MKENTRQYQGCVFFIDILGMGALTKEKIELNAKCFEPWIDSPSPKPIELASAILAEFRKLLHIVNAEVQEVSIAQLSDGAFVYSNDTLAVLKFVSLFMHQAIKRGILCRGGVAFGEIIESEDNYNFGKFIVGKAVTEAVKLESQSKGARILVNLELPTQVIQCEENKQKLNLNHLLKPFTNSLTYEVYDEFLWYAGSFDDFNVDNRTDISFKDKVRYTKDRLKLINELKYNPKFEWNVQSHEGVTQLAATAYMISREDLLGIYHNRKEDPEIVGWVNQKRSISRIESMNRVIEVELRCVRSKEELQADPYL